MAELELNSTPDGYVTVNKVNTLNDSIKGVSKAAKQANNAIKALTEALKVNPEDLKKALIMGALKDAAEGKEVTYEGNVWKDILELVEGLQKENEGLKKENEKLTSDNRNCTRRLRELNHAISTVEYELMFVKLPEMAMFPGKGWVSKRDANEAIASILKDCRDVIDKAYAALKYV